MDLEAAAQRFAAAGVARLGTASAGGRPHLVPITFALISQGLIVSAVDHKPKRTTALRRLTNIAANPSVCVLADAYHDDWEQLWWVRADGRARVLGPDRGDPLWAAAVEALVSRYRQYASTRPQGEIVVIFVERWSWWSAADGAGSGMPDPATNFVDNPGRQTYGFADGQHDQQR